jgi:putative restriction endonuclease
MNGPQEVGRESTVSHWWVNHKQTHRQEIEGEYLWSPKKNQNGANNETYNNMTKVLPGDVVFSFADGEIRAVGVVLGRAREAPRPPEFRATGHQWGKDPGWQVPVRFELLKHPIRVKDHVRELAPVLPEKYSPIRKTGDVNQGVYLAALPPAMASAVRHLLEGEVDNIRERMMDSAGIDLRDDAAEAAIQQRTNIGPREKASLVNARRGQGIYRENLEQIERKCRMTGLLDRRHLRASHIKPWSASTDEEKLDGFNGLLLSPHFDHLFDRGYISFEDNGNLKVSRYLNPAVIEIWRIDINQNVGPFKPEQCKYLEYHRRHVFEHHGSGRREGPRVELPLLQPAQSGPK